MTTSSTTSSPSQLQLPQLNYHRIAVITPWLRAFYNYLRDEKPDLHTFLTENVIVHMGSGKRIIASAEDLAAAVAPSAASPGLATPRRRTRASASDPAPTLTSTQKENYYYAPTIATKVDKDLAVLVCKCLTTEPAKAELRRTCGDSGRAMLLHIEARGKGAKGSPAQILAAGQLTAIVNVGPTFEGASWLQYSQSVIQLAATAGFEAADVVGRLKMGLYHFPLAHRVAAASRAAAATTPDDFTSLVSDYIDETFAAEQITAQPEVVRSDSEHDTNLRVQAALAAAHGRPPPGRGAYPATVGSDPSTLSGMPQPVVPSSRTTAWDAFQFPPCLNWKRGPDGCDGKHHLFHCPLPRPALAVEEALWDELELSPAPALTVATAGHTASAAALDFDRLYTGSAPVDMILKPSLAIAHVQPVDFCAVCCEGDIYDDYDLYDGHGDAAPATDLLAVARDVLGTTSYVWA